MSFASAAADNGFETYSRGDRLEPLIQENNYEKVTAKIGGNEISIETGKIARLADGAVIVTCGDTTVLVCAVSALVIKEGQDFFPLTVDYREKAAAAGKFPGGYFKREGRPTEKETLTSRTYFTGLCGRSFRRGIFTIRKSFQSRLAPMGRTILICLR